MSITGNIKTMQLAELLQWLSQGQKTGSLVFDSGQVQKRILFRITGVTFHGQIPHNLTPSTAEQC